MSSRLYEEFAKKNKNTIGTKCKIDYEKREGPQENFVIVIPMKNSTRMRSEKILLDERFIKVIEHEYAVRYLEHMGLLATQQSIARLLKMHPLSSCMLKSSWNNSGHVADVLHIYPFKSSDEQE
jgi:hypothetical protein